MFSRRRMARSSARLTSTSLIGTTIAVLVGLCLLMTWTIIDSYREAWHQASIVTDNVALLLERDIARNIELFDLSLQTVDEALADPVVISSPPQQRQRILFDRTARASDFGGVIVLDSNGDIQYESTAYPPRAGNFVDREYFQHHVHAPRGSHDLYVGQPFQSRMDNNSWNLPLTRRLNNPDGSFAGVVLGILRMSYLENLFRQVSVGQNGVLYLIRQDGILIARMPHDDMLIGRDFQTADIVMMAKQAVVGRFVATSPIDGIYRLNSFRHIDNLPFVISAGLSVDEFLEGWWRKTLIVVGALAVMVAGVVFLTIRFSLELKRRTQAERALSSMATTDDLTGLPNRRKFDTMFDLEWRRAERDASLFSLLMIDVDFFKKYNDNYGHQDGDKVLRRVAHCIAGQLGRPGDLAARYGGEEFAVLLPQTDAAGARDIAESIRAAVHGLGCPHLGSTFGTVTISVGVATVKPRYLNHPSVLVRSADQALYKAKSLGRNVLYAASDEEVALTA
jgi:diguanylate cyclase (GGDEF)-like protein